MRFSLIFLVITFVMVEESYAYASACVLRDGRMVCTNDQNNGNGMAATSSSNGGQGNAVACGTINGIWECNYGNGNVATANNYQGPNLPLFNNDYLRDPFQMLNFPPRQY